MMKRLSAFSMSAFICALLLWIPGVSAQQDPAQETVLIGTKTADDMSIKLEIEPSKSMWMLMGDNWMERAPAAGEKYHFEVKSVDPISGTRISYTDITLSVINNTTGEKMEGELHPMWGGSGLHYAMNGPLPGDGQYTATIKVGPPAFVRGSTFRDRWMSSVTVEFPFTFEGGQVVSGPVIEEGAVSPVPSGKEKEFHILLGEQAVDDLIVEVELEDAASMQMLMGGSWMIREPAPGEIHFEVKLTDPGSNTRLPYTNVKLTVIDDESSEKTEADLHPMWGGSGLHYGANGQFPGSGPFTILVDLGQAEFARGPKDKDKWLQPVQVRFSYDPSATAVAPATWGQIKARSSFLPF